MADRSRTTCRRVLLVLFGLAWLGVGCGPSTLAFLFMPFIDDKLPPKCKLANPDKEITVLLAARFETLEVRPDIMAADQELAETLAQQLRVRSKENKEKLKIIPPLRTRSQLLKLQEWDAAGLIKVGDHFQADYVVQIDIQKLSLIMPNSFNSLYQGHADAEVTVLDVHQAPLEAVIFKQPYRCEYPGPNRVIETVGSNPSQFRMLFVAKMARDLSRWFTAYPNDQRSDMD